MWTTSPRLDHRAFERGAGGPRRGRVLPHFGGVATLTLDPEIGLEPGGETER